jgi:hypothetical protein
MTPDDPRPRPDDPDATAPSARDERASALVDGLLGEADETDDRHAPDVAARAAEMDAARAALRAVPPPDAAARARAVAAALAAYDDAAVPGSSDRRSHVADLGARRRRSATSGRWLGAAAAAVLLIAVVVVGLVSSSSSDNDRSADVGVALDSADSAPGASESAEGGGTADDEASAEAPSTSAAEETDESLADSQLGAAAARAVDLGTFPSADALLDAAASRPEAQRQAAGAIDPGNADDAPTEIAPAPCPAGVPDPFERAGAGPLLVANGVVGGVTVGVWRVGPPEATRLVVVDPGCAVLAQRPVG